MKASKSLSQGEVTNFDHKPFLCGMVAKSLHHLGTEVVSPTLISGYVPRPHPVDPTGYSVSGIKGNQM